jgi:hypothetical protein
MLLWPRQEGTGTLSLKYNHSSKYRYVSRRTLVACTLPVLEEITYRYGKKGLLDYFYVELCSYYGVVSKMGIPRIANGQYATTIY